LVDLAGLTVISDIMDKDVDMGVNNIDPLD